KIVASQTIKSIDVGFNSLSENGNTDVLRTAYLAVFRFYDEIEKLDIVTLSDKIIISESENTQEYPLMKNGIKGIQVQPGDLIALVLSPGVRVKDLAFTPGKYRIFAREFNTIVPKCQILFKMEPDNGKSKDAKFKVNFSVK
ncbi:MAG: hypothetical protein IKS20_15300, partial [Victivallales bacterium]|nr:hypothetical protein [Victivallales bacterium]